MNDKLEIRKVLVLSTAHAKRNTLEVATKNFIAKGVYETYFYVGDAGDVTAIEDPEDYPPDLYRCLLLAREHGCDEVKFDSDGPVIKGLPTYEW